MTPSIGIIEVAAAKNCEFSPHVYPEVNIHLGAAFPGCVAVEMFDPSGNRLEMSHRFVIGGPKVEAGVVYAPEGPGLGFDIDWQLVAAQGGEAP